MSWTIDWMKLTFKSKADYGDGEPIFGHAGIVDKDDNGDIVVRHPCCTMPMELHAHDCAERARVIKELESDT